MTRSLATSTGMALAIAVTAILVVAPMAGAMTFGVGISGVNPAKSSGWNPGFGQFWVGTWMKSYGWGGLESSLKQAKSAGATPVIEWYYWGDPISPNCIEYGCGSKNRGDWNNMAATLARYVRDIMGSSPSIIVVETEFNKNGVQNMESFDGYLRDHIHMMRSIAPNAKYYLGFGTWGQDKYPVFDRAMGAADGSGFQMMRASTRDSDASYSQAPDLIKSQTTLLKRTFGKPVLLHDLALSSYGGKEWLQDKVVKELAARKGEYEAAGLMGIIWRDFKDNPNFRTTEYFGIAERYWGLQRADGSFKPAWWAWKPMAQGGGAYSSGGSQSYAPAPTSSSGSFDATFSNVKGNDWWIQTNVKGTQSIAKVEARVNGGAWTTLPWHSWGAYGKSVRAPHGSIVELRATSTSGAVDYSAKYNWPSATIASSSTSFKASWSCVKGNVWWEQACVSGGSGIAKVDVGINGKWYPTTKQSWGGWAVSKYAPHGSKVQFKATDWSGKVAYSGFYTWPVA